jgi:hypothetical protein
MNLRRPDAEAGAAAAMKKQTGFQPPPVSDE